MSDDQNENLKRLRLTSASEQARAIARGDTTSAELQCAEHSAIEITNPVINAFVRWHEWSGVRRIDYDNSVSSDLLQGVSFAVKDNFDVAGCASQSGVAALSADSVEQDAVVVAALKEAGLKFSGKCNMSPLALGSTTHNDDFGHCYNPWKYGYTAGGSSGGSAAAVAAGLVGVALGTDTLGSVRIPAAFCGIVGFKPTWESISTEGVMPLCRMLDTVGVLCRSVEDARHVFNIIGRQLDKEPVKTPEPASCVIGVIADTDAIALSAEVRAVYVAAYNAICRAGYKIKVIDTDGWQLSRVRRAALLLIESELLHTVDGIDSSLRHQLPDDVRTMLEYISTQPAARTGRALAEFGEAKQRFATVLGEVDALMLPTCTHTAFSMDDTPPVDTADLTLIANVLGSGAISLPVPGLGGMPVGLQLLGCGGDDCWLLSLAGSVEGVLAEGV